MKGIAAQLMLLLLPIVLFIITFYLTANALSTQIKIVDISTKISKMINELEIYKPEISKRVRELKSEFSFETNYLIIKISEIEITQDKISYKVTAMPKEKIEGISNFVIFYYGSEPL